MGGKNESKAAYFEKLKTLLEDFKSIFIVSVDNVRDLNTRANTDADNLV